MSETSTLTARDARHLLRRSGFGAPKSAVTELAGSTRGEAADRLLDFRPSTFKPGGVSTEAIHDRWVSYMLRVRAPLQEKLVVFWHDYFATANAKVQNARLMAVQNRLLRLGCKGSFASLLKAIGRDPAMMRFLDTPLNHKGSPNENYAHELLARFTLGPRDDAGIANYTAADVFQVARAFTGWGFDYGKEAELVGYLHDFSTDFPERGPKVIFSTTGGFLPSGSGRSFTTEGEGEHEIDAVVDLILQHTDSAGRSTVARRVARRLIEYFAHAEPATAFVDDVVGVGTAAFDLTWDVGAMLRRLFVHDSFYETAAPSTATAERSVKWPVDFVVSSLRLLDVKPTSTRRIVAGGGLRPIREHLANMGQILFDPPSVSGWGRELDWLSSSALLARCEFARDVAAARGGGSKGFHPERFVGAWGSDASAILDEIAGVLGIEEELTAIERDCLVAYLTSQGSLIPDIGDENFIDEKVRGLFALLLQSPAYQLH